MNTKAKPQHRSMSSTGASSLTRYCMCQDFMHDLYFTLQLVLFEHWPEAVHFQKYICYVHKNTQVLCRARDTRSAGIHMLTTSVGMQ